MHTTVPAKPRPPNARIPVYKTSFQSSPVRIYERNNLKEKFLFFLT